MFNEFSFQTCVFNYRLVQIYNNSNYETIYNTTNPGALGCSCLYSSGKYCDIALNGEYKYRIQYNLKQPDTFEYSFYSILHYLLFILVH